jgi:membrane protease YdiL (CAAX protease family)
MSVNWFTPLYVVAVYGLVRYFMKRKNAVEGGVNWTPIEAIGVTLLIYFGGQILAALLTYLIPLARGMNTKQAVDWLTNNIYGQFIFILVVEIISIGMLYWFLKRRQATFQTIGLKRRPKWGDLGYIIVGFFAYFAIFLVLQGIAKALAPGLNVTQKQDIGFTDPLRSQLPFVFASLVLLPPIAEELLVRGFLYTGLKNGLPKVWAILIASGLFGIAHLQAGNGQPLLWIAAIDTFSLSLVLIYIREQTGSLWASIGLHMLKNGIAFASLYIFHLA